MALVSGAAFKAPAVGYGQSGEAARLPLGAPVYRDAAGKYRLTSSADLAKSPAIGVVAISNPQNLTVGVIGAGYLTLYNWTAIVGTQTLVAGTTYYLAVSAGKLTSNPAEGGGCHLPGSRARYFSVLDAGSWERGPFPGFWT